MQGHGEDSTRPPWRHHVSRAAVRTRPVVKRPDDGSGAGSGARREPAPWILVETAPPPGADALLMVDALHRLGARTVEREGERVLALFPRHDDPAALVAELELAIRASTSLRAPAVTWRRLGSAEWNARWGSAAAPLRVSERLLVESGAAGKPGDADLAPGGSRRGGAGASRRMEVRVVRVEPSVAFGSAEHPTTRACLRAVDGLIRRGDRLLDVGAGSGIISIAGVLLGAERARALEADPEACAAARRNAALNGVQARVRVEEVEVRPGTLRGWRRWHGIVANVQSEILAPLIPDLARALAGGGWLVLSGVLRAERDAMVDAADRVGLRLDGEAVDEGWWTGRLSSGASRSRR